MTTAWNRKYWWDNPENWKEDELALIAAVKKYPILYRKQNKPVPEEVKDNCWVAISMEVARSKNRCRVKWTTLKNDYARSKQSGLCGTKYDDSTLSFLDPELEEIQRTLRPSLKDLENFGIEIPTNHPKNTTVIPLLASDDEEPTDYEEMIISQHISINPEKQLPPAKQLPLGPSIGNQSPSSPDVQKPKTDFLAKKGKVENIRHHSESSLLKSRIDVGNVHPLEINKTIHSETIYTRSANKEGQEKDETLVNTNNPKRFKPCSSNSISSEISTITNLSNEGLIPKGISTIPQEPIITVFGSHSAATNKTYRRPVIFETITLEDSDTDDTQCKVKFEPNSFTFTHSKTSATTSLTNKHIACNPNLPIPQEPRMTVVGSGEINKTYQCPETVNAIDLEETDTDDSVIDSRSEPSSSNCVHLETPTNTNFSKTDFEYEPILSLKTELPTEESSANLKSFFSDLSSDIKSKFSLKKQKEIQSRIYSLLISEERKRKKDMEAN